MNALGQLTAEQAKLQATNRRLENELEELKRKKGKKKITVNPNTLKMHWMRLPRQR
jgi:hypothetical protein